MSPHLWAANSAWQCTWTDATITDSLSCQMWRSCTACTPGTLLILWPRSDTQTQGGVACSSSSPYLRTWRERPVTQLLRSKQPRRLLFYFWSLRSARPAASPLPSAWSQPAMRGKDPGAAGRRRLRSCADTWCRLSAWPGCGPEPGGHCRGFAGWEQETGDTVATGGLDSLRLGDVMSCAVGRYWAKCDRLREKTQRKRNCLNLICPCCQAAFSYLFIWTCFLCEFKGPVLCRILIAIFLIPTACTTSLPR